MVLDGRSYTGAAPVPPVLYHPRAPAVGDLCAQALRAAYFYTQHQATLIGSQTWPIRHRRYAAQPVILSASMHRLGEWCAVHLASHHTRVIAQLTCVAGTGTEPADLDMRVVVVDGGTTITGATSTLALSEEAQEPGIGGQAAFTVRAYADISSLTRPTTSAKVYIEAASRFPTPASLAFVVPVVGTAWKLVHHG